MNRFFSLALFLLISASNVYAQDLGETLRKVGEPYARAYMGPFAEALGADLNTGLFHTAGMSKRILGLNVYIGVKASAALLQAAHQTIDLNYQGTVAFDFDFAGQTITMDVPATFTVAGAPSFFGEDAPGQTVVTVRHDTTFSTLGLVLPITIDTTLAPQETIGGKFRTDYAPTLVPQIGLGTVLGTDIMVRWLPKFSIPEVGSLELFGFGVRHNLNQYLPVLPVDLAIQAAWQHLRRESSTDDGIVDARTFAVNVAASKRFGVLTLYAGLQTDRSDIEVSYLRDEEANAGGGTTTDPDYIAFTLSQMGRTRGIFGMGLKLGPVVTNADISVGTLTVVSAGFGFAF